jgi:nitrate reductase NapE component
VCFSPEVDVVAGLAIGAVGIDAVRHVRRPAERLLAAVPLVLAVHQLVEAFVWWGLQGKVPAEVGRAAEWLYLVIAFGVLPVLVPLAVAALEPVTHRRRMQAFVVLGVVVASVLTYAVLRGPSTASIVGHHIDYRVDLWHGGLLVVLYVVATCGSLLASEHRHVRAWGAVNLVVVLLLAWLNRSGFISLWCVWAAITSVAIAWHLRHASREPDVEAAAVPG